MPIDYAERARALVGTRFRPQGRGCNGLDCIGVVLATFGIDRASARHDYSLRDADPLELDAELLRHFRRVSPRQLAAGDIMMMTLAERQLHLAVRTEHGFVHAHAGLRRVVETPGLPDWKILRAYRRRLGRASR